MASTYGAVTLAHRFIRQHVVPGDFCIDATAGRGNDTALLCELCGSEGKVLAFDIQPMAVESTRALLAEKGYENGTVLLESHSKMADYAQPGTVDCITFNFGWLPGADHTVSTKAPTSIEAIRQGLTLLKEDGIMSLCIYYGRCSGFEERDAILDYVRHLDSKDCTVIIHDFANRSNCPPIFVSIEKGI